MGCEPDVPCSAGALDQGMYDFCKEKGVPTMLLKGNTVLKNRGQSFIKAGDGSFKKMGTVKTKFIQDLLELGRIIIEKKALDSILREHQSDLSKSAPSAI